MLDGGYALKAHAGVYGRFRQGAQGALRIPVELHENKVPDLDIARVVIKKLLGLLFAPFRADIAEDLGAGTARTGIAHGPEIVFLAAP